MNAFARPFTLEQAVAALSDGPRTILAGGTDLYPAAQGGLKGPVLDLSGIAGLRGIRRDGGLRIGACTTWNDLAEAALPPALRALQQAARQVGGRQIQNMGTIGGNLCNASPAADSVPAMIAARATCRIVGPNGERLAPVESIPTGPGRTSLAPGEFIAEIRLPARPSRAADAYLRMIPRTEMDIAIAGAAVNLTLDAEGRVSEAHVALGAVAPTALLVPDAGAALVGGRLEAPALAALEAACRAACRPISDKRGTADYRTKVAGVLARRAALIAYQRAGGQA